MIGKGVALLSPGTTILLKPSGYPDGFVISITLLPTTAIILEIGRIVGWYSLM